MILGFLLTLMLFRILADSIEESNMVSLNVAFNDTTEVGLIPFLEAVGRSTIYSLYILGNCFSVKACMVKEKIKL